MPSTSPPSALIASPRARASAWTSAISATDRPLVLAACRFRGGLRFRVELEVFAGMDPRIPRDANSFAPRFSRVPHHPVAERIAVEEAAQVGEEVTHERVRLAVVAAPDVRRDVAVLQPAQRMVV